VADGPDFSRISRNEIAAAPAIAKPVRNDCEIVGLVPLGAAPLGVKFKGRKPDEIFWFRGEKGERLFAECRWNLEDGAKEVRPACFTDQGWKLVAYRAPRPIYNLDKLAAWPGSPVWLFEGPRKADRAEACFPGAVTSANAGGANAIKQTDLAPLRGRNLSFLDSWATKAAELGWTDFDLFGADVSRPEIAWLNSGLLWSSPNHSILDLRDDRAILRTLNGSPQTFYRTPHLRARALPWEISH